jgi:single-stranded-DNA-specific exonuclease
MTEWIKKNTTADAGELEVRSKKIPKVIVQILNNRGYDTPEKIEKFFAPTLDDLHDPFLMPDIDKAVERIIQACQNKEKILLHGDYDTDGITAVALLNLHLQKLGARTEIFIPNRFAEGYGLSTQGIDHAVQKSCSLVITADCGIMANAEVAYAAQKKIDAIVCDHHEPGPDLPQALAVVDPKLSQSSYPFKELAGVGVAFKVVHAVYKRLGMPIENLFQDLDLVALGTVTDVVPLTDENRVLVKTGLKKIKDSAKIGFKALLAEAKIGPGVTSYHLGFMIGPRLNACGRLRDAQEALELLLTKDHSRAQELAQNLTRDNQERQQIEKIILEQARVMIEQQDLRTHRVIVIGHEQWHEGVIGIVASRIAEAYSRPTVLLAIKKDSAKGSCRSIPGFDIAAALKSCSDLLVKFGGHKQAAGLELKPDRIEDLSKRINEHAAYFSDDLFTRRRFYDLELDIPDLTEDVIFFLKYFEPTGTENPQPVFRTEHCEVVGVPRVVGTDTLMFTLRKQGKVFDVKAYRQAENILTIKPGKTYIDCLYSVSEDSYTPKHKVVLLIKDMTIKQ